MTPFLRMVSSVCALAGSARSAAHSKRRVRIGPGPIGASESKCSAQGWAAEPEVLDELVVALIVIEVPVSERRVSPGKRIGDAEQALPGQAGRSGADVEVVGHRPLAAGKPHAPASADDRVEQVGTLRNAAGGREGLRAAR